MPPKKAGKEEPPPEPPKPKNLKVEARVYSKNGLNPDSLKEDVYFRVCSEWLDCSSSDKIGSELLPWVPINENDAAAPKGFIRQYTYATDYETENFTKPDFVKTFNLRPGIFVFLMKRSFTETEPGSGVLKYKHVPLAFTYVDCSLLLIDVSAPLIVKSDVVDDFQIEAIVTSLKPFLPKENITPLEPVILKFDRMFGFPLTDEDSVDTIASECYMFSRMNIGMNLERMVFVRPTIRLENIVDKIDFQKTASLSIQNFDQTNVDDDSDLEEDLDIRKTVPRHLSRLMLSFELKICFLPGCTDKNNFKEIVTSTTYEIEVYRENLLKRVFTSKLLEQYDEKVNGEIAAEAAVLAAPVDPKAKGAPPPKDAKKDPKKGAAETAPAMSASGPSLRPLAPVTESDKYIMDAIFTELEISRQINYRGSSRFRLEGILSESQDLLKEFSRLRKNPDSNNDEICIQEDMKLECRLEKPCKPIRWSRPSDLSLIKALDEEKKTLTFDEHDLNNTVFGSTKSRYGEKRSWHERFLDLGTHFILVAELIRQYKHPTAPPPVMVLDKAFDKTGLHKTLSSTVRLENEDLQKRLSVTPFARMVFICKYDNDEFLEKLAQVMVDVNQRALPDIQGTIRSYSFTKEELQAAKSASLDVITGFTVIDDDFRIIIIEGLAGPGQGMQQVFMDLPRMKENDSNLKMLCNPDVLFPVRLYSEFNADLKRIRVREKLKKLVRRPELYNRKQVEEVCFKAIDSLMTLRRAEDLWSTKFLDMYPSLESLNKLELLYGEAISRADIDGNRIENLRKEKEAHRKRELHNTMKALEGGSSSTSTLQNNNMTASVTGTNSASISAHGNSTEILPSHKETRKEETKILNADELTALRMSSKSMPTDTSNQAFEEFLRTRPKHRINYLAEQAELRKLAWDKSVRRCQERDEAQKFVLTRLFGKDNNNNSHIHIYSCQSMNIKEKAMTEMRNRLSAVKNATFTFSKDFVSQTLTVAENVSKIADKSEWLTPTGFQYPKPKTRREMMEHPKRPSDARIEDLQQAWEGDANKRNQERSGLDPALIEKERGYIVQIKSGLQFGALAEAKFEEEFQLKFVGDREKLPRGKLINPREKDPSYFKSVHLCGVGGAKLVEEALEAEKKAWHDKVLHENLEMRIGGFKIRDIPLQCDRAADILKDEPNTIALKKLRTKKSDKGRDLGYTTAPMSLMTGGPYNGNATASLSRTVHPEKFITTLDLKASGEVGKGDDFVRYYNRHENEPKVVSMRSVRVHPPQDPNSDECVGPKWGNRRAVSSVATSSGTNE